MFMVNVREIVGKLTKCSMHQFKNACSEQVVTAVFNEAGDKVS